jgi:hypothetical protein
MANSFLQTLLSPEVAMPMAQALMGQQGNMANFGNALGAYGTAQAQRAGQNKTLEYFRQNAPEFAAMVESGMPMDQAWQTYAKQRFAQQADPYLSVGGKIFNKQDQSWISPPSDPNAAPETGLVPQMMKDEQGNTIFVQPTKDGRLVRSQVPEGFQPYDPYAKAYETGRGTTEGKGIGERNLGQPQAEMALGSAVSGLDRLENVATEIRNDPALSRITGVMGMIPNYPGSAASGVQSKLQTLKSQVSFTVLQAMRDASKTGGALGQVSDKENELLQNNLAALNQAQSVEDFQRELDKIIEFTRGAKQRLQGAYNQTYGGTSNAPQAMPSGAAPAGGVVDYRDYFPGGQ